MELKLLKPDNKSEKDMQSNGNSSNNLMILGREKTFQQKFSISDFKLHPKCTYFEYGKTPINQHVYYCAVCDPNNGEPICQDCNENCHKNCNKGLSTKIEEERSDMASFICECGKKKHEIESRGDSAVPPDKKCYLLDLDIKIKNRLVYWCTSCNVTVLCYTCYAWCHTKCKGKNKKDRFENLNLTETQMLVYESPNKGKRCECTSQTHLSIISMNTYVNYVLYNTSYNYDTFFIWKLQLVNCIFDSDVPSKLFFPVENFFRNFSPDHATELKKVDQLFNYTMIRVTNNIYTPMSVIFFYYHPRIIATFPLEKLIGYLYKFKDKDLVNYSDLVKALLHIIFYVHLKKDFQNLKNLCVYDFLVSSTLDRLLYRHFLHTDNVYTKTLHEKYFDKQKNKYNLPKLIIYLTQLLEKACNMYKKIGLSKCFQNYGVCLKIIFFSLKRMVFDVKSLINFISALEKFCTCIHKKLKEIFEKYREKKFEYTKWWVEDKNLYRIMTYLAKITYMVTVNYNDLIIQEALISSEKKSKGKKHIDFIHTNSEHANKLFKIIINTSLIYASFILNNDIYNPNNSNENNADPTPGNKYLNLINETIELFAITDNVYFKQLEQVDREQFMEFYKRYLKISKMTQFETTNNIKLLPVRPDLDIEKSSNGEEHFSYKEMVVQDWGRTPELTIKKLIFDLKEKTENLIELFFSYKISLHSLYEETKKVLEDFGNKSIEDNRGNMQNNLNVNTGSPQKLAYSPQPTQTIIREKKVNKYKKKILNNCKEIFKFLNENDFQQLNEERIDMLIQEMTYSNIDITLTKLFMTDFIKKNYPEDTIQIIFKFLALFCLSKEGVKYFCIGRNLRRIIKIFEKYQKCTLEFLCLLFKGVHLYDINISYHKRLTELMTIIKNFIKLFNVSNDAQEKEFKEYSTYTIKILQFLSNNFDFDELMIIKKQIFDYVEEKRVLDKDKIIKTFPIFYPNSKSNQNGNSSNNLQRANTGSFRVNPDQSPSTPNRGLENHLGNNMNTSTINNEEVMVTVLLEDRDINLDLVRENFEREKRINKNKMPSNKNNLKSNRKMLGKLTDRLSERDISNDFTALLQKDKGVVHDGENEEEYNLKSPIKEMSRLSNFNYVENRPGVSYYGALPRMSGLGAYIHKNTNILNHIQRDHKFFFSFIKLISNFTHYFLNNDNIFMVINQFNDLEYYKFLLNKNYLPMKYRIILLKFIRTIYFTDILDGKNYSRAEKYFNSEKFPLYFKRHKEVTEMPEYLLDNNKKRELKQLREKGYLFRMDNLNYMKQVIEILIQEMNNFILFIYLEQDDIECVEEYIYELLCSTKIISDVFVTYDISSHMTLYFYELAKEFLKKANTFKNYINYIRTNSKIEQMDVNDMPSNKVMLMENRDFDIYDTELIYSYVLEVFNEIYTETDMHKQFKLETFLRGYMENVEKNFKVFCLNNNDNHYINFLQNNNISGNTNSIKELLPPISENKLNGESITYSPDYLWKGFLTFRENYTKQFLNIYDTTFMNVICSSAHEMEIDYKKLFFDFCITYLYYMDKVSNENFISMLTMLNKLLLYETKESQKAIKASMDQLQMHERFFLKYVQKLDQKLNVNIVTSKNFLIWDRYDDINHTTKIMIQFIQLLGEGHEKCFQSWVINARALPEEKPISMVANKEANPLIDEPDSEIRRNSLNELKDNPVNLIKQKIEEQVLEYIEDETKKEMKQSGTIFQAICKALQHAIINIGIKKNIEVGGEMPYDKLIVLIRNIVDCIEECFQGSSLEDYNIMYYSLRQVFPFLRDFMFNKSDTDTEKEISNTITQSTQVQTGVFGYPKESLIALRKGVHLNVKINIMNLLTSLIEEGNTNLKNRNEMLTVFPHADLYEEIVSHFFGLIVDFKAQKKIPEPIFSMFINNESNFLNELVISKFTELYIFDEQFQNSLELKISLKIFYFLKFLADVYKTPIIKNFFEELESGIQHDENELVDYNVNNNDVGSKIRLKNKNMHVLIYKFLNRLLRRIEINNKLNESEDDYSFFVIPPICFLLSNQTMNSFVNNVDRDSAYSKITSLISETDYFIYEMFFNNRLMRNVSHSPITKALYNINLYHCEMINYFFIILQNLLLLAHFYRPPSSIQPSLPPKYKYTIFQSNLIVSVIQLCLLAFILVVWIKYKFTLYFQHNLLKIYNKKFIFKIDKGDGENSERPLFSQYTDSIDSMIDNLNSDIHWSSKIKVAIVDTILSNREVNMFVFTALFIIFYFATGSAIFLVFCSLFAANLSSILFGIVLAIRLRWVQLITVLFYTYLVVYVFSWIAYYFYQSSFEFNDPLDVQSVNIKYYNFYIFRVLKLQKIIAIQL